jgi:ribosomal protein L40E
VGNRLVVLASEDRRKSEMKVCINCYSENPPDEVLCSECGMSLTRAPTGEMARMRKELKEARRPQPEEPPTASGIVYLFGEEFAKPWRWTARAWLRFLFGSSLSVLEERESVRLAYSGREVRRRNLATRLFEVAFVSLAQEGYISLRVEQRNSLLRTTEAVTITEEKKGEDLPPSLERAIMDALRGEAKQDRVEAAVGRVIGATSSDPFQWVVRYVMDRLAETGYLGREVERRRLLPEKVHWSADEEAIRPLAGEVETLKARVETFATVLPHLDKRLTEEVRAGIGRARGPAGLP